MLKKALFFEKYWKKSPSFGGMAPQTPFGFRRLRLCLHTPRLTHTYCTASATKRVNFVARKKVNSDQQNFVRLQCPLSL